jgi:hypothetical protein
MNLTPLAVNTSQFSHTKSKPVPMRLSAVGDFMLTDIHTSGSNFVQLRFPDMRPGPVDQGDLGFALAPEGIAQLGGQLQPGRAPSHDDNAVRARLCRDMRDIHGLVISHQRCSNTGLRLERKAAMPSRWSFVPNRE